MYDGDLADVNVKARDFLREMNARAIDDDLEMLKCCEFGCVNKVPM